MVYVSGYHVNIGIYNILADSKDVIFSDALNHASIIDGLKLSKAKKVIFKHNDLKDLEDKLKKAKGFTKRFIVTEGVFSMEGDIPDLKKIISLCKKYKAVLLLDDCHGTGVLGKTGRGAIEHCGVDINDIGLLISTLSKGLGGGGGGYVAGKYEVIKFLNQRSRSYIFSSTLGPPVV